ncbi:MAG: DUF916 domain-containing protein [Blastococcus sp.]|nr:DUF916 domain-containing protein [Blastococcus sp.]
MDFQPHQRAVALALTAVAFLLAGATTASAASTPLGNGFNVRPDAGADEERAPSYFTLRAEPGAVLDRRVLVSNGSDKVQRYRLDAVDGLTGTTSGTVYANREDRNDATAEWLTPSVRQVTLQPGESRKIPFRVSVPESARPGDHVGGLAFQDSVETTAKSNLSVTQVVRIVVGVRIIVPGGNPGPIAIGEAKIRALPGTSVASVELPLENTGERLCRPDLRVVLTAPDGKEDVVERTLDTLLPGARIAYPLAWPRTIEPGTYGVRASVTGCGAPQEYTGNATLRDGLVGADQAPKAAPPQTVVKQQGGLPGWAIAAIAGGALLLGLAPTIVRRYRRTA